MISSRTSLQPLLRLVPFTLDQQTGRTVRARATAHESADVAGSGQRRGPVVLVWMAVPHEHVADFMGDGVKQVWLVSVFSEF